MAAVKPYFERFLARWPTVDALAAADLDQVLVAWQGLGYYARARNLHACARHVAAEHGGRFPGDAAALRALPGIGDYTAAAIAAIAFHAPTVPVDGNVVRVLTRLCAIAEPLPGARPAVARVAERLASPQRPGDLAQALMDLGATVCTPTQPGCMVCPWSGSCRARAAGAPERFPVKAARAERPVRLGVAFWTRRADGAVLLRRRPETGLLGGMMEIPSTDWRATPWRRADAVRQAPLQAPWRTLPGTVTHTFTHFRLELEVLAARSGASVPGVWCPVDRLGGQALPTVMKKIVRHALAAGA